MRIAKKVLSLNLIQLNYGQIEGLPANPRKYTDEDVVDLALSIKETPELLKMRCPIVVPWESYYVTLGGNRRVEAANFNEEETLECFVVTGATIDEMKQIVIKDNGSFGKWDEEMLLKEWQDLPLQKWGVDMWQPVPPIDASDEELLPPSIDKQAKIVVIVPKTYEKEAVLSAVKDCLKQFPDCSVK